MKAIRNTIAVAGLLAVNAFATGCITGHGQPTIANLRDVETVEGVAKSIAFTVGDSDTPLDQLRLTARTSNSSVVPANDIAILGSGANRVVTILPATNAFGRAMITVEVSDGRASTSRTFAFVVHPVNGGGLVLPPVTAR